MAVDDFEQPSAAPTDPRRACKTEDTPPELAAIFEPALDALTEDLD